MFYSVLYSTFYSIFYSIFCSTVYSLSHSMFDSTFDSTFDSMLYSTFDSMFDYIFNSLFDFVFDSIFYSILHIWFGLQQTPKHPYRNRSRYAFRMAHARTVPMSTRQDRPDKTAAAVGPLENRARFLAQPPTVARCYRLPRRPPPPCSPRSCTFAKTPPPVTYVSVPA